VTCVLVVAPYPVPATCQVAGALFGSVTMCVLGGLAHNIATSIVDDGSPTSGTDAFCPA